MKVAVILGNRMKDDGTISDIMKKRLEIFLELNQDLKPDYIICSGGIANMVAGVSEASKMKEYLVDKGIRAEKIIEEDHSMTTRENAIYSCMVIKELKADEVIVCSSVEHFTNYPYNVISFFAKELENTKTNIVIYTKSN